MLTCERFGVQVDLGFPCPLPGSVTAVSTFASSAHILGLPTDATTVGGVCMTPRTACWHGSKHERNSGDIFWQSRKEAAVMREPGNWDQLSAITVEQLRHYPTVSGWVNSPEEPEMWYLDVNDAVFEICAPAPIDARNARGR